MNLYLIQHGLSLPEEQDPKRPLSPEGEEQTQKIAEFLKARKIKVDCIWHSSKLRAIQTAQIISESLPCPEIHERNDLNPLDSVSKFPEEIKSLNKNLMIVGHLPFLEKLAALLLTGTEGYKIIAFKNSGIVCLECTDAWKLAWIVAPELAGRSSS
jgi:phosphohistidine phosphatase